MSFKPERKSVYVVAFSCFLCILGSAFTMNNSEAAADQKAAAEVTKGRNGIDQIVLRNSRGASARVRNHFPPPGSLNILIYVFSCSCR